MTLPLGSAAEVWDYFVENGGLEEEGWDVPLVSAIREELRVGDGDMRDALVTSRISTEALLGALLGKLAPFAAMMSELLELFAVYGIKRTDGSAEIVFDFDSPDLPPLSFDLEAFRRMQRTWVEATAPGLDLDWFEDYAWDLWRILTDALNDRDWWRSRPGTEWFDEYADENRGAWPAGTLAVPKSDSPGLDAELRRAAQVWEAVLVALRGCSNDLAGLRKVADADDSEQSVAFRLFRAGASDHWQLSVANAIVGVADPAERNRDAAGLAADLRNFFDAHPFAGDQTPVLAERLESILDLPIWKHRYDLYSAWVLVPLLDAAPTPVELVSAEAGVLRFPFKATRMARLRACGFGITVWSELRTPLSDPVGESRKGGIQPDYSVVVDPPPSAESSEESEGAQLEASLLEIECKQYKQPNNEAFAAALQDYAAGRPNADVLLVSHGPLNSGTIRKKVPVAMHSRTEAIGHFHPGGDDGASEARSRFHDFVSKRLGVTWPRPVVYCRLDWDDGPEDLDLHLFVSTPATADEISYENFGSLDQAPYAQLAEDVQKPGTEILTIDRWVHGARYLLAVHAFGEDGALGNSGARVMVSTTEGPINVECPTAGRGRWWIVATYNAAGGLELVDKLQDAAPAFEGD